MAISAETLAELDLKPGDTIRLWRDTDSDEVKFTLATPPGMRLWSRNNGYYPADWDHVEKLASPRPSKPGLYTPYLARAVDDQRIFRLHTNGSWWGAPLPGQWRQIGVSSIDRYNSAGTLRYIELGGTE